MVLFGVQAFQNTQTGVSAGYFALSLYFLYNSKMLVQRRNEAFRYIQYFNYAVILMQLVYQVRCRRHRAFAVR